MLINGIFVCDICGKELTLHQISYCSDAHKMKAYRQRKKLKSVTVAAPSNHSLV
jgi:hypothetical protein